MIELARFSPTPKIAPRLGESTKMQGQGLWQLRAASGVEAFDLFGIILGSLWA